MAKRPLSRVQVARARAAELKAAKARAVRAQRISERLKLGPLRDRVVSAVTLKRYKGSVKEFFRWCRIHGYRTPSSTEDFDMLVTAYAEMLWCEGDPRTVLAYTLAGFSHLVPSLRHRLNGSWRVYVAWGKSEPAQQAPPLTLFMTQAIAGWFISEGFCGAGLGILLAFNCTLRAGELFEGFRIGCSESFHLAPRHEGWRPLRVPSGNLLQGQVVGLQTCQVLTQPAER